MLIQIAFYQWIQGQIVYFIIGFFSTRTTVHDHALNFIFGCPPNFYKILYFIKCYSHMDAVGYSKEN